MTRLHIGLVVADLERAKAFYSKLFGEPPVIEKNDYVKWTPENPKVNFTIVDRQDSVEFGAVHFGIEAENATEFEGIVDRLEQATNNLDVQDEAICCYHKSKKVWGVDADAYLWEAFHTYDDHSEYGEDKSSLKAVRDRVKQKYLEEWA